MSANTDTTEKLYSAEDLLAMPKRIELVRGKLVGVPPELLADSDTGTATETGERLYTAEDLLTMPKGFELVRGKLVGGPRKLMANNPEHAWITIRLGSILDRHAEEGGSLRILSECGFVISRDPDTLRTPDIAVVGEDRYRAAVAIRGYFRGVPDLAIEVLSPGNSSEEMDSKIAEYFDAGVHEVWTISVWRQGVTVYRPDNSMKFYRREDTLDGGELLPGFRLPLAKLFPD